MIKIWQKLQKILYSRQADHKQQESAQRHENSSSLHASDLQLLYESWLQKEEWLLYTEGLPLLLGLSPDNIAAATTEQTEQLTRLRQHARYCIDRKALSVLRQGLPEEKQQVSPLDLYRWAVNSGYRMPDELVRLAEFILMTVKPAEPATPKEELSADESLLQTHLAVLQSAFYLLAVEQEACRSDDQVNPHAIAQRIIHSPTRWFRKDSPPSAEIIVDILQKTLQPD